MKRIIKKILSKISYFIRKLFYTLEWGISVLIGTDLCNHVKLVENAKLLSILANGPSLKEELKSLDLENGDFMVLNDFCNSQLFQNIKPKYYILADPWYFENPTIFTILQEKTKWAMKLFVPYYTWNKFFLKRKDLSEYISIIPFVVINYKGFEAFRFWIYGHGLSMPRPQNVLVPAIFNGINMGYEQIRLYGVDHSWIESIRVNNKNEVCQTDSHFYDEEEQQLRPWCKSSGEQYKLFEILNDLSQTFKSYFQISKYALYKRCGIINCTKKSYIDAFERG